MTHTAEFVERAASRKPADGAPEGQMVDELHALVQRGQQRWKRMILLEAAGLAIAAPLAYLWLVFWIDNVVHLAVWGRAASNLVFFSVIAWLAYRLAVAWRKTRFTEDQVAMAIENRTPSGVQNRLINSIQLSRDAKRSAPSMRQAVLEENYRFLQHVRLEQSAGSFPAVIGIAAAVVLIVVGLVSWSMGRERFTNAATRIFLPFADIEPVYRTTLLIAPGDIEAAVDDDVTITVDIQGRVPQELLVLTDEGDRRSSDRVVVDHQVRQATYTFAAVRRSMAYAVRGGDYTSRYYQINVTTPLRLDRLQAVYRFPEYTRLGDEQLTGTSGDLEALSGTRADVTFSLNQQADRAWLLLEKTSREAPAADPPPTSIERIALEKTGPSNFVGQFVFQDVVGYQLEAQREGQAAMRTWNHALRVVADRPPELQLAGLQQHAEVMFHSLLALRLAARDDYGLTDFSLIYRQVSNRSSGDETSGDGGENSSEQTDWRPIQNWNFSPTEIDFHPEYKLALAALDVIEGEALELTVRARDTDPSREGRWTDGPRHKLLVSSAEAHLQVVYESILQSETSLGSLIEDHQEFSRQVADWTKKLDPASGFQWEDVKNKETLAVAVAAQRERQSQLQRQAAEIAQDMVEEAGSLRTSASMLAGTEMDRSIRILDAVPRRETRQAQRGALADARMTIQRTVNSLQEILDRFIEFREDWELTHMVAFTKMLADRQKQMAEVSGGYVTGGEESLGKGPLGTVSRRQTKLEELTGLAQMAFRGMAGQEATIGPVLAAAFDRAYQAFDESGVKSTMETAAVHVAQSKWVEAATAQRAAAQDLATIHDQLRKAQAEAAQLAIADLKKLAESSVDAQAEIDKLDDGSGMNVLDFDPESLEFEEVFHLRSLAEDLKKKQYARGGDGMMADPSFEEHMEWLLASSFVGEDQKFDNLSLANKPSGQFAFPNVPDSRQNIVKPNITEKYEDLVGDLLEEVDDLRDDYKNYNINADFKINDPGDIGKQGGDINSTSGSAATGNMKPPTHNIGGASRTGRQGARAHGLSLGEESINRRGRDAVQEGQQEVPDAEGEKKETLSDDPQSDTATGVGGKVVDDDQTSFSTKDAGEWKDEMVDRLREPQKKNQIVERQGKPLDPHVAERMRDLESNQEQVIERIKAIKKQLDQMYLPSDHLDDIMDQLKANLDRLKDKPARDLFRRQIELLGRLKGAAVVFGRSTSGYEQSVERDQRVRGRILDESAAATNPGYEDAVNRYYEKLSGQ